MTTAVFKRWRGSLSRGGIGALLGPLLFALIYFGTPFDIPDSANAVLAAAVWVIVWWVTEPVHIAVTSLLPIALLATTGVVEVGDITAQYAHPVVFLLLGGFMLALAVEKSGLHRRIAVLFMTRIGRSPARMLLGMIVVAGFLSMWISNTATTMLLLPIAMAIAAASLGAVSAGSGGGQPAAGDGASPAEPRSGGFSLALLLGVAYGASIGGAATLIGSTPSAIFAGIAGSQLDIAVAFVDWMLFAVPIVVVALLAAWLVILRLTGVAASAQGAGALAYPGDPGPMRRDERRVTMVFVVVIAAWLLRPFVIEPLLPGLTDAVIALAGGIALFLIPSGAGSGGRLMSWADTSKLPWDVLVLIGGSFAVAYGFQAGGLDAVVAGSLSGLAGLPLVALVILVAASVMAVSNVMSNTATVTVFLPVLMALAPVAAVAPVEVMAPAALAASFAFVLPVSTPPNAIVYSRARITVPQMARVGIILNLVCVPLVALLSYLWLPLIQPFG